MERLTQLNKRRKGLIDYLLLKVDDGDWHGVADAAMDLREIEAEVRSLGSWGHSEVDNPPEK